MVSPENSSIIYAGDHSAGIFKSIDRGRTWFYSHEIIELKKLKASNATWQKIEGDCGKSIVAPSSPNIVYSICYKDSSSGGHSDFKKSVDYGKSWEILGKGLPHLWFAPALAVDPNDSKVLFASWANGGLYRSMDGGQSWQASDKGLIGPNFPHYFELPPLHKAVVDKDIKILSKVLRQDVNVNEVFDGNTPILLASDMGILAMVKLLYAHGASFKVRNSYGYSPLHLAVRRKNIDITKFLLKVGADVNEPVLNEFVTPLIISIDAQINIELIKVLIKNGADLDNPELMARAIDYNLSYRDYESSQLELVKLLFEKGVPLTYENSGNNLVLYAAWLCEPEIVSFFLKKGLTPNLDQGSKLRHPKNGNIACYEKSQRILTGN
jgi:hypothetical protein